MWRAHLNVPKPGPTPDIGIWHLLSGGPVDPLYHLSLMPLIRDEICSVLHGYNDRSYAKNRHPLYRTVAGREKLAFVFGFLAAAIAVLAGLSWFQNPRQRSFTD
jgi:hypothetical protein